ncbi:MAG: hypothetical protein KZQ95_13455 [Candidatus Thiodiazotropha sp. (ex Epidulcina cf. delphinae)]|nr:hypothetical protein [Candidatus Thiodiazotropha sp. (ex Epidulcina cf. delphinae)]
MEKWKVYTREARTQIDFAERSWIAFLAAESREDVSNVFFNLQHFIGHAALINKILEPRLGSERQLILSNHLDGEAYDLDQLHDTLVSIESRIP